MTFDYAKTMYDYYKTKYLESGKGDEEEFLRLIDLSITQLRDLDYTSDEILTILMAREVKDLVDKKQ